MKGIRLPFHWALFPILNSWRPATPSFLRYSEDCFSPQRNSSRPASPMDAIVARAGVYIVLMKWAGKRGCGRQPKRTACLGFALPLFSCSAFIATLIQWVRITAPHIYCAVLPCSSFALSISRKKDTGVAEQAGDQLSFWVLGEL